MTPLKDIIAAQYLHKAEPSLSEDNRYTLSSGEKTDHYYDIKAMMGDHNHMNRLTDAFTQKIVKELIKFRSFGGTELGGIPLATRLQDYFTDKPVCFIRKSQRIHGMKKRIEGVIANPVLLVDDVINSTNTMRDAITNCILAGFDVVGILCVVNRSDTDFITVFTLTDDANKAQKQDYPIHSLFTEQDFGYGNKQ
jgi:orotate phosphoribosyltransferase